MAYRFGMCVGLIYAGAINILLNSLGMGSGIIFYVMLTQLVEAGLIGLLKNKCKNGLLNITFITSILSVVIKPIAIVFYAIVNTRTIGFVHQLAELWLQYFKNKWFSTFSIYLISALAAYEIIRGIDFIMKKKEETFYEKN